MRTFRLFWLFLVFLAFSSCKKEDVVFPSVILYSPSEGDHFAFGSFLPVHFKASDENGITEVHISVYHQENLSVIASRHFSYNKVSVAEENIEIQLNDIHLLTGTYTISVTASDGTNERVALNGIYISGAPRIRERLLVIRQPDSFSTIIDSLNNSGSMVQGLSRNGSFSFAAANSWHQSFHLAGKPSDGIVTFSAPELFEINQHAIPYGLGNELFTDLSEDKDLHEIWFSAKDGFIRAIDQSGNISSQIEAYYPHQVLVTKHFIYSYGENGATTKRIEVFNKITGQLLQTLSVNEKIVDLLPLEFEDRILVVRNHPGGENLIPYERQGNFLDNWTNFHQALTGTVISSCEMPGGAAIAGANGIQSYSHDGMLTNQSTLNYQPVSMVCEDVSAPVLWVLENGTLHALNISQPGMNEISSYSTGGGDKAVVLIYNK